MQLPNHENAYIPSHKLSDYLLSRTHPVGRWKASFFRSLGFNEANLELLKECLLEFAHCQDVVDVVHSEYGTKFIIDGSLRTPSKNIVQLRTVWIICSGEGIPYFVTAYPL